MAKSTEELYMLSVQAISANKQIQLAEEAIKNDHKFLAKFYTIMHNLGIDTALWNSKHKLMYKGVVETFDTEKDLLLRIAELIILEKINEK